MMYPYLGFISLYGFNFAPRGWLMCQGQYLSIAEYTALYSLLGTTYGGDGVNTFCLPDLRGRLPIGYGQGPGLSNYEMGQTDGTETTSIGIFNLPSHSHQMMGSTDAQSLEFPLGNSLGMAEKGKSGGEVFAAGANNLVNLASSTSLIGGSSAIDNMQPYLALNYAIAIEGIYPSRS